MIEDLPAIIAALFAVWAAIATILLVVALIRVRNLTSANANLRRIMLRSSPSGEKP